MARALQFDAWNHTSMILAAIHNAMGSGKRRVTPEECHPMIAAKRRQTARLSDVAATLPRRGGQSNDRGRG